MMIRMENKYTLAVLSIAAVSLLGIGIASAHGTGTAYRDPMMGSGNGAHMGMTGMMQAYSAEDIDEMKEHHPDLTDEDINKMVEGCPMMRSR